MSRWQSLLIPTLVFGSVVLFVCAIARISHATGGSEGYDAQRYIAMAVQPFTNPSPLAHEPPYTWRILTPLLVHILPVPTTIGFQVTTLVGLGGTVLVLPRLLEAFGLSLRSRTFGTVAFIFLVPAVLFNLFDQNRVDPLAFLLLTLALYTTVTRRRVWLVAVLALLALDKEVVLLGAVFAVAWSWQHHDRAMIRWSLIGLVVSLLILELLRVYSAPPEPYTLWQQFGYYTMDSLRNGTELTRIQLAIAGAWGILLPLAAWHLRHPHSIWKNSACWLLLLLSTLQILVSSDTERVVVYAFPVVIAAAAFSVDDLAHRWGIPLLAVWLPTYILEVTWYFTNGPVYLMTIVSWQGLELALLGLLILAALIYPLRALEKAVPTAKLEALCSGPLYR